MDIRLTNTLTREKQVFSPMNPQRVTMYVCGPTVYSYAHIGNARPPVVFDVLFRLLRLKYGADHVVYAANITDVDDKIINAAAETGQPIGEITALFEQIYREDMAALGVTEPNFRPHPAQHVAQPHARAIDGRLYRQQRARVPFEEGDIGAVAADRHVDRERAVLRRGRQRARHQ